MKWGLPIIIGRIEEGKERWRERRMGEEGVEDDVVIEERSNVKNVVSTFVYCIHC